MKQQYNEKGLVKRPLKLKLIISYILISIVSLGLISVLSITYTSKVMTEKVGVLTTAMNGQFGLTIENFIEDIEGVGTLIFADEDTYNYRDSAYTFDAEEKEVARAKVNKHLSTISMMYNFGDFGIVYKNNTNNGFISDAAMNIFGADGIYNTLLSYFDMDSTQDGWFTGVGGKYNKIYYVRKINHESILFTSIYTAELGSIMDYSAEMQDMIIRIIDNNGVVIYSTMSDEIGNSLDTGLINNISGKVYSSFVYDGQIITLKSCGDSWRVMSTIPTKSILKELSNIKWFTIGFGFVCLLISSLVGIIIAKTIVNPVSQLVKLMKQAEKGDLRGRAKIKTSDEIGVLGKSFNGMMENISHLIHNVSKVSNQVEEGSDVINEIAMKTQISSENVAEAMDDIAKGSVEQLNESQKTFQILENLADNINQTIIFVKDAAKRSNETMEIGKQSVSQVDELYKKTDSSNETVQNIAKTFDIMANEIKKVESVITVIINISEETNLLALNASIEAARAGEAGRGFSVVADQIMKLAKQTDDATNNIKDVISHIYQFVNETLKVIHDSKEVFAEQKELVEQFSHSFENIIQSTNEVQRKISSIDTMANTMNELKNNSLDATTKILSYTENASASTEEVLSVTDEEKDNMKILFQKVEELSNDVTVLQSNLSKFKVSKDEEERL